MSAFVEKRTLARSYDPGMAAWFEPLIALLAEQPPDTITVTLTLGALEALANGPLPAGFATRPYWWRHDHGMGRRLAVIGWQTAHVGRRAQSVTFARIGPVLAAAADDHS